MSRYGDEDARIDYEDNATTLRFRKELRAINEWLDEADITFDAAAFDKPVDVQARQLRRQLTLGRFDRGGRLFGGFWIPKPVRLQGIRIEGEEVAGLDYSALNPRLAWPRVQIDWRPRVAKPQSATLSARVRLPSPRAQRYVGRRSLRNAVTIRLAGEPPGGTPLGPCVVVKPSEPTDAAMDIVRIPVAGIDGSTKSYASS